MYLQVLLLLFFVACSQGKYKCGDTLFTGDKAHYVGPVDGGIFLNTPEPKFCEYKIIPREKDVYTILEWDEFDVQDYMPKCSSASVTVFIG